MTVAVQDYITGMRQFPAAVNLICAGRGDARRGMTASAVMSLTAEPAQIGAAIARTASAWPQIEESGAFVVNTLPAHHLDLARRFAGPVKGAARFEMGDWDDTRWGPVLGDALVALCCEIDRTVELSSHTLLIGRVMQVRATTGVRPLVYVDGEWTSLVALTPDDEDAYRAAVTDSIAAFAAAQAAGGDAVARLVRFVRAFTHVHIEKQAITRAYFNAELYVREGLLAELNARKRELDLQITDLLEEGRRSGAFAIDDARLTALALSGMVGWVHRWYRPGGPMSAAEVADRMAALALRMVGAVPPSVPPYFPPSAPTIHSPAGTSAAPTPETLAPITTGESA